MGPQTRRIKLSFQKEGLVFTCLKLFLLYSSNQQITFFGGPWHYSWFTFITGLFSLLVLYLFVIHCCILHMTVQVGSLWFYFHYFWPDVSLSTWLILFCGYNEYNRNGTKPAFIRYQLVPVKTWGSTLSDLNATFMVKSYGYTGLTFHLITTLRYHFQALYLSAL